MLYRLPRPVVALLPAVFLVLGVLLPMPIALLPLLLALLLLGWLSSCSWPVVPQQARTIRVFTLALLVGIAIFRLAR